MKSKLSLKGANYNKKDDDYETPKYILEMLLPFIKKYDLIYDPFYCNGKVKQYWNELGKECINDDLDAFDRETPECDIIISNIPFTLKKECVELCFKIGKPFILLFPIESLGSKWIQKYFNDLQFIIPEKRLVFEKNDILTKSCWFDTCFYCYGLDLDKDIIKL
tara:strand:- start:9 stop:500 length:492 start_codon:yes stop_codon:yes gene_type:complete